MKSIDKDTRFYLDIDVTIKKIINLVYDNRFEISQNLEVSFHKIFITKGQFNKLSEKY